MERRNTIQRELVLQTLRQVLPHATAEELYEEIAARYPSISRGTVYRNLNLLAQEGAIRKVELPGEPDHYDRLTEKHYHLQCTVCKKLIDAALDPFPDLRKFLQNDEGMTDLDYDITFKGICRDCRRAEEEQGSTEA